MKKFFFLIIVCITPVPAKDTKPALIVYISIDQMRADYFDRYGHYFTGGFSRLYHQGITYTNADLNYATSETGPGHATLGTGCFPWKSGIQGNEWIEVHTLNDTYCVSDSAAKPVDGIGGGFSPRNLVVTAIGDWLKNESPKSKVITASLKDRAAILMGGKHPDYAFWYSQSVGGMVTSDYYAQSLPAWVKKFNTSNWAEKNVPQQWAKSLAEKEYAKIGPDEFEAESQWNDDTSFPHAFTEGKRNEQIMGSPYGDKLIVDFAMKAVESEQLGSRGVTDLLCISLSNCDYVGHAMGPDSHEMLDLLVKVDRYLGDLFTFLDERVGKDRYIVALSADHAVCPLPEFNSKNRNISAKRYDYKNDVKAKVDSLSRSLQQEFNATDEIIHKNAFLNYAAAQKAGIDSVHLEQKVRAGLLSIETFVDVFFRRELLSRSPSTKPFIEKYRNSYYAPRGEDFQYRIRENCIISSHLYGSTHGSPYEYDTHIPVLFWRDGIRPRKISRPIFSADVAPTLATCVGFTYPENIDGTPLMEVVR